MSGSGWLGTLSRHWAPWALLLAVVVAALVVGSQTPAPPQSVAARNHARVVAIASQVRCPSCQDLSAEISTAPTAVAVRHVIARRVAEGQSTAKIEAYLVSRYGDFILLKPSTHGIDILVWALPVAALVVAVIGLLLVRRRRRPGPVLVTEEERMMVEAALYGRKGESQQCRS